MINCTPVGVTICWWITGILCCSLWTGLYIYGWVGIETAWNRYSDYGKYISCYDVNKISDFIGIYCDTSELNGTKFLSFNNGGSLCSTAVYDTASIDNVLIQVTGNEVHLGNCFSHFDYDHLNANCIDCHDDAGGIVYGMVGSFGYLLFLIFTLFPLAWIFGCLKKKAQERQASRRLAAFEESHPTPSSSGPSTEMAPAPMLGIIVESTAAASASDPTPENSTVSIVGSPKTLSDGPANPKHEFKLSDACLVCTENFITKPGHIILECKYGGEHIVHVDCYTKWTIVANKRGCIVCH